MAAILIWICRGDSPQTLFEWFFVAAWITGALALAASATALLLTCGF